MVILWSTSTGPHPWTLRTRTPAVTAKQRHYLQLYGYGSHLQSDMTWPHNRRSNSIHQEPGGWIAPQEPDASFSVIINLHQVRRKSKKKCCWRLAWASKVNKVKMWLSSNFWALKSGRVGLFLAAATRNSRRFAAPGYGHFSLSHNHRVQGPAAMSTNCLILLTNNS